MLIDLSVKITPAIGQDTTNNELMVSFGHLGTHFDVMNKEFPIEFTRRKGIVFDVRDFQEREIEVSDIDIRLVERDMFTAFYTGFIERELYGTKKYLTEHPQLSDAMIEQLLDRKISIIGIDFAGVRRGAEHTPKDQYCADRGVFIVENLCHLGRVLDGRKFRYFTVNTYPINFVGMTGLPCRVVAEVD